VLIYLFRTRQQNNITATGFYKKKREDSMDQEGSLYAAGAHLNSAHTCDLRNERAGKEKMASAQILRRSPSDDEILQSRLSATCFLVQQSAATTMAAENIVMDWLIPT
jgi:hypothetical protein